MPWRRRNSNARILRIIPVAAANVVFVVIILFFFDSARTDEETAFKEKQQPRIALPETPGTLNPFLVDNREGDLRRPYESMEDALGDLAPAVRASIRGVEINDDPAHYQSPYAAAHCEDGKICIKSRSLKDFPAYLLHEGGHAYTYKLMREEGADKVDRELNLIFTVPISGYSYGCRNKSSYAYEILADFLMNFHLALRGLKSSFDTVTQFEFRAMYADQFDYLRRKGFITEENRRRFLQKKGY